MLLSSTSLIDLQASLADTSAYGLNQWLNWLGNWHMVVLHLPIGLFLAVICMEFGFLIRKKDRPALSRAASHILALTAATGIIAAALGWLLHRSNPQSYGSDLIEQHEWQGIALAIGLSLAWLLRLYARSKKRGVWIARLSYPLTLIICTALLTAAGHTGGAAVHGKQHLTRTAPPVIKPTLQAIEQWIPGFNKPKKIEPQNSKSLNPTPEDSSKKTTQTDAKSAQSDTNEDQSHSDTQTPASNSNTTTSNSSVISFAQQIQPILSEHCYRCHHVDEKIRGDIDLSTRQGMLAKGDYTQLPALVPGDAQASQLWVCLTLDEDDDLFMPYGADPLSQEAILVIQKWIEQGASVDN